MKLGPSLIITIGAAVGYAFIHDTVHLLDLAILMSVWLLVTVPLGVKLLHHLKGKTKPPKQLTELEELWLEVDRPMTRTFRPPEH